MEYQQPEPSRPKSNPLVILLLVVIIICSFGALYLFGVRPSLLQMADTMEGGITREQVVEVLGQPVSKKPYGKKKEVWKYVRRFPAYEEIYVILEKDGAYLYTTDVEPEPE